MRLIRLITASAYANSPLVLLTVKEVCFRLKISEASLRRYVASVPGFPQKVRIGPRRIGFPEEAVEAYMKRNMAAYATATVSDFASARYFTMKTIDAAEDISAHKKSPPRRRYRADQ